MIIYEWMRKKKCMLSDDSIIVGGVSIAITDISEVQDYKTRIISGIVLLAVFGLITLIFAYKVMLEVISANIALFDRVMKICALAIYFAMYVFVVVAIKGMLGYASYWKVNSKMLFVEKADDKEVYVHLKRIERMKNEQVRY